MTPDPHEDVLMLNHADLLAVNDMTTAQAGPAYASAGLPVFPVAGIVSRHCSCPRATACDHPAKHPLVAGGLRSATTDLAQVTAWWRRWPWANIGLATGSVSGLVVLDVDPRSGGAASLDDLRQRGLDVPATIKQHTGGGGAHLFYAHPGIPVPNSAGHLPGAGDTPGLDLRGDGGYVLVAPSRHISGRRYRWENSSGDVAGPAVLPGWLQPVEQPGRPAPAMVSNEASLERYVRVAVEREAERVARAKGPTQGRHGGTRNDTLVRSAFSLGTLVGAGALQPDHARTALLAAAGQAGLSAREAERTIASGLDAGRQRPRRLIAAESETEAPSRPTVRHGMGLRP